MKLFIVVSVLAIASASPIISQDDSVFRLFLGNIVNCVNSDLGLCLKEQALKATERLGALRQLKLTEGITILNNAPKDAKSLELSAQPEERKRQITDKLWESTSDLLKNSEVELSFDISEDTEESRSLDNGVEEGRGKKKEIKKKIKMLLPLMILAKAKAIALVVLALLVIAASLAKLAFLAKIAFIAKIIAIIKHLLHKKHEEEHAWIPHHEEHGGHGWEGGWSRSRNEGNNLAYSAYAQ